MFIAWFLKTCLFVFWLSGVINIKLAIGVKQTKTVYFLFFYSVKSKTENWQRIFHPRSDPPCCLFPQSLPIFPPSLPFGGKISPCSCQRKHLYISEQTKRNFHLCRFGFTTFTTAQISSDLWPLRCCVNTEYLFLHEKLPVHSGAGSVTVKQKAFFRNTPTYNQFKNHHKEL